LPRHAEEGDQISWTGKRPGEEDLLMGKRRPEIKLVRRKKRDPPKGRQRRESMTGECMTHLRGKGGCKETYQPARTCAVWEGKKSPKGYRGNTISSRRREMPTTKARSC